MGLLDFLYDPGTYGQGGLLSRLQPSLAEIPQSQGFPAVAQQPSPLDTAQWPHGPVGAPSGQAGPIGVGNYQMPRVGQMASFTPPPTGEATIPQNAQPTQGQMPQMEIPTNPGGLSGGLRGFLGNLHTGPLGAIAGGIGGAMGMQDPARRTQQQLFEAFKASGMSPSQAYIAVMQPQLASSMMGGGQTDDIKEYNFAKREDPSLTFEKFMQRKKSVTGEYSLNPVYGTDEKGNTVLLQTGKSGEAIQTKLPAGVKVSSGVEKIDLGTEWGLIDKRTGTLVGKQSKDIQGKEAAEERGKIQGQAQGELPAAEMTARRTIEKIDEFTRSKGFNEVFGALDQFRPNFTMSNDGRDALSRFNQLSGSAFLEGRQMLKGGGAITDFESRKAEAAIARLERSLSEKDAKQALEEFKDAVRAGADKLRVKAGAPPAQPTTQAPVPTGGLPSGWTVRQR